MENNRIFKFIWRANAVFLFAAGLLLIGILLIMAALLISDLGGSDTPPPTASSEQSQDKETFRISAPSKYERQSADGYAYFELRSGTDDWSKFGSGGDSSQLRNIGAFDLNTDTIHWVFPDARQEIESFFSVKKSVPNDTGENKSITTGFLLTVAKSLTDGTISRDLWVMTPDGQNLEKIFTDISRRPNIETFDDDKIKLLIETKSMIEVYPFDVDRLTIGKPTKISIP